MKAMTCNQLGGACEKEFQADDFDKIAVLSKSHGMEMFQAGDKDHLMAMKEMRELMNNPDALKTWFDDKRKEFDAQPEI